MCLNIDNEANNEVAYDIIQKIYNGIIKNAKNNLKLGNLPGGDQAFFDKILTKLTRLQKSILKVENLVDFINNNVKTVSGKMGIRDLKYPKTYGKFYFGKSKSAAILQSVSMIAASTTRYLSYLNYGKLNSINKMMDILVANNIPLNKEKIGTFGGSGSKSDFKQFFRTISSFVSYYRTGQIFDKRNGYKHSAAFLECFHKKIHDLRWVEIDPQNGLLVKWEDGIYYREGKRPERPNIMSAWEYLISPAKIKIGLEHYTGRVYEIFGRVNVPLSVFRLFVLVYCHTNKDIGELTEWGSYEWRQFLCKTDLTSSARTLRKQMCRNLQIMKNYVDQWITQDILTNSKANTPKQTDQWYQSHSGYYTLHMFAHSIAKMGLNDIPYITHLRHFTEPHVPSLIHLFGSEVAWYQMFLDYISLIYGKNAKYGREQMQKLVVHIRDFALNPNSKYTRSSKKYIPPYPDSEISENKYIAIFSIHQDSLELIAATQPIPDLFTKGLYYFGKFRSDAATIIKIGTSEKISIQKIEKEIDGIDSAPESDLYMEIFWQFCRQKTEDSEETQIFEVDNELYIQVLKEILGENEIIKIKKFKNERRPKILRRKVKPFYNAIGSAKWDTFIQGKKVVHSKIIHGMKRLSILKKNKNFDQLMNDILHLYRWPIRPKESRMVEITRASELYTKIIEEKDGEYVQLRWGGRTISHDLSIGGIMFEISEYLQSVINYGDPTQGLIYIGNKIYSVKISITKGRPICFVVKDENVQAEYKSEFDNLGMKTPIITKKDLMIWMRMIKGYIDIIGSEYTINEALNIINDMDLLKIFNPINSKLIYIQNKNLNTVEKLFDWVFQGEDASLHDWNTEFLDYFFKKQNNPKYCNKFMLYYELGRLERLAKDKRELKFQKILSKHNLKSLEISYQIINPQDKYVALCTDPLNYGHFVLYNNKVKILNKGEEKSGVYSYRLLIENYHDWKNIWYAKFLSRL